MSQYEIELSIARKAVQTAGQSLLNWDRPPEEEWKGRIDPVSEADRKADRKATSVIEEEFNDILVTEETESLTEDEVRGQRRWYLDPLDGTTNFLREFEHWNVSLAFVDEDDEAGCAAVYAPSKEEIYLAERDRGATLNGEPISVSGREQLKRAVAGSGFPYTFDEPSATNLPEWSQVTPRMLSMRCLGAAALDLCEVARGRLDAFWEKRLGRWDIAAGAMIAREAGATVTNLDGKPMKGASTNIFAATPSIHGSMLELLQEARPQSR